MRSNAPALEQCQVAMLVLCLGLGLHAAGCGPFALGRNVPDPPATTPENPPEAVENDENAPQPDGGPTGGPDGPASVSPTPAAAPDTLSGYRVQLYWFTTRDAAEAAVKRVEQFLADGPHGVYLIEEGGGFRVRVGDFTDKADADRFRDRLRREGFVDAWTAEDRITAP